MTRCAVCNSRMVGGIREGSARYCSAACYSQSPLPNFCERCLGETTEASPAPVFSLHLFGMGLYGTDRRCPECHSVVQRKWLELAGIPVIRIGRYRMRYSGRTSWTGRRLRD